MRLIRTLLIGVVALVANASQAETLEPVDAELAVILNNLVPIHKSIEFNEQGYEIKFFGNSSKSHCSAAEYCRPLVELLVLTSELDSEGPLITLYRLPRKHEWKVEKWDHLANGKQGIYLNATTYESNEPNSLSKQESFLLTTTWLSAEINAL